MTKEEMKGLKKLLLNPAAVHFIIIATPDDDGEKAKLTISIEGNGGVLAKAIGSAAAEDGEIMDLLQAAMIGAIIGKVSSGSTSE